VPRFDPELWKRRAFERFKRARARGQHTNTLFRDIASIDRIEAVVEWCEARGIDVTFDRQPNGEYDLDGRRIFVNGRLAPESQLFILLHECGHSLIGERNRLQRYGNGHSVGDMPHFTRRLVHRVDVIDEELEAWHRGLRLAQRLGIDVNVDRYNLTRARYVRSYIRWATGPSASTKRKRNA
jgi:hypothetical protein